MAKIRDILLNVSVEKASRKRKCHRNKKHFIQGDELFLSIRESDGLGSKNYCLECAKGILDLASTNLSSIREKLGL